MLRSGRNTGFCKKNCAEPPRNKSKQWRKESEKAAKQTQSFGFAFAITT